MSTPQPHRPIYEYLLELGIRLEAKSITIGYASIYTYRLLLQRALPPAMCLHTMATAAMLLAGKVTNDPKINTRDVMNLSYRILHPDRPPLELGELSYSLREGLIAMELAVVRFLRFRFDFDHPHQDLTMILCLLRDWMPSEFEAQPNLDRLAATFLQDLYVCPPLIVDHNPKSIAILVISMALSAVGAVEREEGGGGGWIRKYHPSMDRGRLERLIEKVLEEVYNYKQP